MDPIEEARTYYEALVETRLLAYLRTSAQEDERDDIVEWLTEFIREATAPKAGTGKWN